MEKITIYTDGSSRGNPGPGGWGAIIINEAQGARLPAPERSDGGQASQKAQVKEIGGREKETTNNKMELTAAIRALKAVREGRPIEIHTDSEYLMKGITIWIKGWQKNNWRTKDRRDVLNKELWLLLLEAVGGRNISWKKVAGHSGHALNDRCDKIATSLAEGKPVKLYNGPKQGYSLLHPVR